jgi:very-short-patch-repair endonuclease
MKRARSLRRKMTLPEVLLWNAIRNGQLPGLRFRRQHPVGPYILDFFCASARLAVEVDGAVHSRECQSEHDRRRDHWLSTNNVGIVRVLAADILNGERMQSVLASIVQAAVPSTASRSANTLSLSPPTLCVEEEPFPDN